MSDIRVTGQLRIVVLKARHLQNKRKLEKQNPYVTLRIGHIVEHTSVDYRGGQTPQWDDECKFELTPDLEPLLQLSILDETKKTPTLIAEKKIDITPAFSKPPNMGYDNWYKVEYAGREAGEIFLEMTFYPTAPQVPLKIPMKNRSAITRQGSARPLPTIPGGDISSMPHTPSHELSMVQPAYTEDILVKSFSSSFINNKRQSLAPALLDTIPLDSSESDRHNRASRGSLPSSHHDFPISKTESNINQNLSSDLDKLFINSESDMSTTKGKPIEFRGFKKLATKFQQPDVQNTNTSPTLTTGALFKKRSFLSSPKKHFLSKFSNQFNQQQSTEDDFDLLEQQVQSDWEQNHPHEFQEAINRRFGGKEKEEEEEEKTSSWTRSISSLNKNQPSVPLYIDDDDEESDTDAPPPPPKSNNSSRSGNSLFSTHRSVDSTDYEHILELHQEKFKLKSRKPPPLTSSLQSSRFSDLNIDIEIPYSADSIGVDTKTFKTNMKKQQRLPDLPNGKRNDEVMQSKYHAPRPDETLARKFRLESGVIKDGDLEIEPGLGAYQGSGTWGLDNVNVIDSFSPSRFKPKVPAKVPIGLTNEEYYVIDRKNYLKDLNGKRE